MEKHIKGRAQHPAGRDAVQEQLDDVCVGARQAALLAAKEEGAALALVAFGGSPGAVRGHPSSAQREGEDGEWLEWALSARPLEHGGDVGRAHKGRS